MEVFELLHIYYTYNDEPFSSLRLLGLFSSKNKIEDAIAFYKTKRGYKDSPNAFVVRRRKVIGDVNDALIWEAVVYSHTFGYEDCEFTAELGLFASKDRAEKALKAYYNDNELFFNNNPKLEIEKCVNWYKIDERYCIEGFVVEPIS